MNDLFDPNDVSTSNGNYFALPYNTEESALVLLSVPWDVTASYGGGASDAPDAIIDASEQVDLYDYHTKDSYKKGIGTIPIEEWIIAKSALLRKDAQKVINHLAEGGDIDDDVVIRKIQRVNAALEQLNDYVYQNSKLWLDDGKIVGLVGGDHSTPLGLIKVLADRTDNLTILHIDAHADLRKAFEGFTYSHASIMYNVLNEVPLVKKIVQVGVRDFCENEFEIIENSPKVETFFDAQISQMRYGGATWNDVCDKIIASLSQNVYISFDIDGLSVEYCPTTGTPVPGGLSFNEAVHLLWRLVESGRKIVGFDLNEVSEQGEGSWNANVGARILYKLSTLSLCNFKNNV